MPVVLVAADGFTMRPEVQDVYDRYERDRHGEVDIPGLCEAEYNSGADRAVKAMVQFTDLQGYCASLRKTLAQIDKRLADVESTLALLKGEIA
jgi:hypothetical protein